MIDGLPSGGSDLSLLKGRMVRVYCMCMTVHRLALTAYSWPK